MLPQIFHSVPARFAPVNRFSRGAFFLFVLSFFLFSWLAGGRLVLAENNNFTLSESDVVTLVLRQNLDTLAQALDPQIAQTAVTQVQSRFDTLISGQVFYDLDQSEKENIVYGTDNRALLFEARVQKKLPQGVEGAMTLSNRRDSSNSPFATAPVLYEQTLALEARAPFLKNRFGKTDRGEVAYAQAQQEITRDQSLQRVEDITFQVVRTYWNLVAAQDFLQVTQRFLTMSEEFLRVTRDKKVLGISEDPDVLAAEALVLRRKTEVLRAKNLIQDLRENLRNQLDLRGGIAPMPKEDLGLQLKKVSQETIYAEALKNRSDYQAILKEAKAQDIRIAVAKDQKLPGLDLVTSLELNEIEPEEEAFLFGSLSGVNPRWLIAAQFTVDLENRLAKSSLERGRLEKARALIRIKKLENDIAIDIDEAYRELQLQRQEEANYTAVSALEKKKLDIEVKNFSIGRSSSDIIVRFQDDYLNAERERLESELRVKQAWVRLRYLMAVLVPPEIKTLPSETS